MPRFRLPVTTEQAMVMLEAFYRAEVERRYRDFSFDNEMQNNLIAVARALTADNSKFGLLLCGECGNGKSTFLYAIQNLINWLNNDGYFENKEHTGMIIMSAKEIANSIRQDYQKYLKTANLPQILAIDDLGTEPYEIMEYGNIYNPVVELIEIRYNRRFTTFLTSNLDPEEIREKYKERTTDRLREMVEQIVFERTFEESYRRN